MLVVAAPTAYWDWISPLPEGVIVKRKVDGTTLDFIHLFVKDKKLFERELLHHKRFMKSDGMIWVSWPKKSSKVPTDVNENLIRDFALNNGLVDIKVCAVDEVWSGLKLVIPVKDR